jgi:ATP-dependent Lhr-like helicase
MFSDTAIFDESIKVTFHKDLDIDNSLQIIDDLREGEVEFQVVETGKEASPIARLGLERVSMRSNIIPPETMKKVIIESAKARLLNEALTFICTKCWKNISTIQVKNLPGTFNCHMCSDSLIGMLKSSEEDVKKLMLDSPRSRSAEAVRLRSIAKRTAQLFSTYGKAAAVVFAGKNLDLDTVESILLDESTVSDRLFELIVDEERKALSRRF